MILWRVAPWSISFIFVNIITLITWLFRLIVVHCDWNWPMETEKPKSSLEIMKSFHRSHHVVVSSEFPHYNTNFSSNPGNSQTWALKHHVKSKFMQIYSRRFLGNFLANHILQPALSNCARAKIVGFKLFIRGPSCWKVSWINLESHVTIQQIL